MTREEAIEKVRQMSLPKETMEILEALAPELHENKDERIRKEMLKELVESEDSIVFSPGKKERWIAYLERQKENPKSADSIPSDCVSDAKCEDRWHKVSDSLPDNPREVLCKDEAGNYFIGRYYVGEGWDISNYDDEDKPHHLNPPVSKWVDFPSEKQKEQKVDIDKLRKDIYQSGYNDGYQHGKEDAMEEQKPKIIIPKFSIGEYIKPKPYNEKHLIKDINENGYVLDVDFVVPFKDEDVWEVVEQEPAEWSEEDEKTINDACFFLGEYASYIGSKNYGKSSMLFGMIGRLKSLRPQPKCEIYKSMEQS